MPIINPKIRQLTPIIKSRIFIPPYLISIHKNPWYNIPMSMITMKKITQEYFASIL